MKESSFWSTSRASHVNVGLIVRIGLALFTTIGSIVLALSLLSPNQSIYASGPIKNHGSGSIKPHAIVSATTTTNPWAEVLDGTGHIYVAEPGCALFPKCASTFTGVIGRYNTTNPTSGAVDYAEPSSGVSPALSSPGYLAIDASGNIWFTEPTTGDIGELTPGATPVWQNWSTGSSSIPRDLTFDKFGNIWFTDPGNNKVNHFNTTTHTVDFSEPLSAPNSDPWGILTDSTGNVWFGENGQANLGEIVPAASVNASSFHEYPITPNTSSHMLTLDSAGNIWYSEGSALALGKFNPTTHGVTNYSVNTAACVPNPPPCSSTVAGIGIDSTGKVWWDDQQNQHVGWLDPTTSTTAAITVGTFPFDGLVVDGNNNVWVTENSNSKLDEIQAGTVVGSTPTASPSPSPSASPSPSPSPSPTNGTVAPVSKQWYLAEGKVGAGFKEYITIENPDPVNNCDVNLLYLLDNGGPVAKAITVPHASRFTENVNADIGIQPNSSAYHVVSTSVTVDSTATPNCAGVVTERPMYFTNFMGISSGSDVVGATQFGTTFYFADVPTGGGFASYITILNPSSNSSVATVTATYYAGGQALGTPQTVMVQPGQRGTIIPNNTGALRHAAMIVTSDQPVMVERPTYFNNVVEGNAQTVSGAASVVGTQTLSKDWLFAEGYTGGHFQEYLVLANFGTSVTTASVKLEYSNGHTQTVSVNVPAKDQAFLDVNALNANPLGTCDVNPCQITQDVSAEITAGSNIIAQREMYFQYTHIANGRSLTATGGTDVIGEVGPASVKNYSFAEGYTNVNYDEWLTLQNPTASAEMISVKLVNEDGNTYSQSFVVAAHSRATVDIVALVLNHLLMPNDTYKGYEVSMVVQSSDGPFVAERPMYWNTSVGGTQGGSDAIGFTG